MVVEYLYTCKKQKRSFSLQKLLCTSQNMKIAFNHLIQH